MILRPIQFRPVHGRSPLPHLLTGRVNPLAHHRFFHASPIRPDDGLPNHYATLGIDTTASATDVKKNFFQLSKKHHPDHNPHDPTAADRFVKISEAYHVLGSADKRARYDRDFLRAQPSSSRPNASYSSAAGPAGSRPATGLSRRRTQFKGPPPSFYRNGGWGEYGQKRADFASQGSHQHEAASASAAGGSAHDAPGTGPAGYQAGSNYDVPHWDREGHFRTHDNVQKNRHKARRRPGDVSTDDILGSTSMLFNFVLLSGVLTVIFGVSGALLRKN